MWFRSMLKSLVRSSRRRQKLVLDGKQRARRLLLEGLEDRRLLAFVPAVSYPAGSSPQAVVTADFNADGQFDLATANYTDGNVSVLLGNANGTFQPAKNSPTGAGPLSLAVGDFDEDGKLDLATANSTDVSVLKGDGLGGFAAPASIGIGSSPSSVAVGDFNVDGNMDLAVGGHTSYYIPPWGGCGYYGCYGGGGYWVDQARVSVLMGNGAGGFGPPISYELGSGTTTAVAVADLNADGKADVVTAADVVHVLLGNGDGMLQSPRFSGYGTSIAIADINGDGKLDLATAGGGAFRVSLGDGLGAFGVQQYFAAGANPTSVAASDFNGDGRIDLAASDPSLNSVHVLLGAAAGAGTVAFKPPLTVPTGTGPLDVVLADFNGDGRADVAAANAGSNNVSVLLNDTIWPALDAPSITIGDAAAVTEGNTGTVSANFTVSLSAQYNQPVSVVYSTQDYSAAGGSDYQTKSQTLTFNPGETSKIVSVLVTGDRVGEYAESFFVKLSDPQNAFVLDGTAIGTILDDEPIVSIDGYYSDVEGNTGTKAFTFTVSLSNEYDMPVTIDYSTADLTPDEQYWYGAGATAGVDYEAKSGTVTFAAHQTTSETITVLVNGDREGEYDEPFFVNLSNPSGATLGPSQALGNIANDEPYVWIDYYASQPEGNTGQAAMTFTLHLSNAYDLPVTVDYATTDGNAVAGSDYAAVTGTATIPANETTGTFTVLVSGDTLQEADEYFSVSLTGATNASLSSSTAYGYILDDDTPPAIYIGDASIVEGNSGTRTMSFTVSLSNPSGQAVSVNYATANGTAKTSDNDYLAVSARLDFAPGETTKTINVTIRGDTRKEANEYLLVKLSGAVGATIADGQGQGTIANDDGGGKGHGKGNRSDSFALAVDAAFDDWMAPPPKKRGR